MSNYTRWYREGTVSLTKNSKTVNGTNTYWQSAGINPGDLISFDNGNSFAEIESITDGSTLNLKNAYTGDNVSGAKYAIVRNFTATMPSRIAANVAELLGDFTKYIDNDMQSIHGKSAYEVAVHNGFEGTESEWLESLLAAGEWVQARARLALLETTSATHTTDITTNASDIDTLKSTVSGHTQSISTNAGNISANASAIQSNAGNISALQSTVSGHTSTLSSHTTSIADNAAAISANSQLISANTGNIATNATNIATNAENIAAHAEELVTHQEYLDVLNEHDTIWLNKGVSHYQSCTRDGFHNSIARGKLLGTEITAEQWDNIRKKRFLDMYIGDWWKINDRAYWIGAFGWRSMYGGACSDNGDVVLLSYLQDPIVQWGSTTDVSGGFASSELYTAESNGSNNYQFRLQQILEDLGEEHVLSTTGTGDNNGTYAFQISTAVNPDTHKVTAVKDVPGYQVAPLTVYNVWGHNVPSCAGEQFNGALTRHMQLPFFRYSGMRKLYGNPYATTWLDDFYVAAARPVASNLANLSCYHETPTNKKGLLLMICVI